MPRLFRPLALAAFACALVSHPAAAAPDLEEARVILDESCQANGASAEQCACLGGFIAERFTEREIIGAAIVFADPASTQDPAVGLAALSDAGYGPEEIASVLERIVSLETTAEEACPSGAAADDGQ